MVKLKFSTNIALAGVLLLSNTYSVFAETIPVRELKNLYRLSVNCDLVPLIGERLFFGNGYAVFVVDGGESKLSDFVVRNIKNSCEYILHGLEARGPFESIQDTIEKFPPDLPPLGANKNLAQVTFNFSKEHQIQLDNIYSITIDSRDPLSPEYGASITATFFNGILISASVIGHNKSGGLEETIIPIGRIDE